jgi:hypothetical protein
MKGNQMNTRTSIVHQPNEPWGLATVERVHLDAKDVDGTDRYALHIGWDLTLIGSLDQFVKMSAQIANAVLQAVEYDRANRIEQDATQNAGVE